MNACVTPFFASHLPATWRGWCLSALVALAVLHAAPAHADIWGYVDAQGKKV